MNLEDRLRRALRREDPGEDFADRVLARLGEPMRPAAYSAPATRDVRRWALAASVVLALAAAFVGREAWLSHTQRIEAERILARNAAASRDLAVALELTSRELESVHRHLNRTPEETGS